MKKMIKTNQFSLIKLQWDYIDGLVQERRNSIANTLELRLVSMGDTAAFLH